MSDIFEIKGVNAVLKIGEKEYRFADPPFLKKVSTRKKFKALEKKFDDEAISYDDFIKMTYELNKESIMQYLPDIDDKTLDKIGEFSFLALLNKVQNLTQTLFGATVEKIEKK